MKKIFGMIVKNKKENAKKDFSIIKIVCVFILIVAVLVVSGCEGIDNIVLNNMSDLRINYFEGKNDNFYVNLSCGYREEVFNYDGISSTPTECGVLSLGYFDICSYASVTVVLIVDGEQNEYVLEKSPFENVYMEDIGKILTKDNIVKIKLKGTDEIIVLNEISNKWKINYKKAIEIGAKYLKEKLESLYFNGTLHAEGYLKVVSKIDYEKKYWYFALTSQSGENYSLLIDVESGEIISNNK